MGRIVVPRLPLFPIEGLNLSGYWRNYAGPPVPGTASAGTSGSHTLDDDAGAAPGIGPSRNGRASLDADGLLQELRLSGNVSDYITPNVGAVKASWSAVAVIRARSATPAQPIYNPENNNGPYNEKGIVADSSGVIGPLIFSSDMGVGAYVNCDAVAWKSVHALMPLGSTHVITARQDGANASLAIGIDGPPNHSNYCVPRDIDEEVRILYMFRGFMASVDTHLDGLCWVFAISPDVWDDALFAKVVRTLRYEYGVSTSQPANVETNVVYPGCHPPDGHSYVGTELTSAAAFSQRDGAKLRFMAGKYWLFGGWNSTPNPAWDNMQTTNEVWSSVDRITWTLELAHDSNPPVAGIGARPRPRHTAGDCFVDGYWYIVGSDQYDIGRPDVWRTADGVTWERRIAFAPWGQKVGLCVGSFGTEIHVIGGQWLQASVIGDATSQHYRSQDGGVTWQQLPDAPFARSFVGSLLETCGLLVLVGGNAGFVNDAVLCNDTWAWNGSVWRHQSSSALWTPRMWIDTAVYDQKIWALAGRAADGLDAGGAYYSTDAGQTWNSTPGPWPPSHADGITATDADGITMASGFGINQGVFQLARNP